MIYICASTYGGIDWHDSFEVKKQLRYKKSYAIPKEKANQVIIDSIYNKVKLGISKKEFSEIYKKFLETGECEDIPVKDSNGNVNPFIHEGKTYYSESAYLKMRDGKVEFNEEYWGGQITYSTIFYTMEIKEPCYIVLENFLVPTKGIPSVDRMYRDYFTDLDAAKEYFKKLKIHKAYDSVKEFIVDEKENLVNSEWYKKQMEANMLMREKNVTPYHKTFNLFVDKHIENLSKF